MHTPQSNQLHEWIAQHAQSACYLLLDPQLRPLEADSPLAQALDTTKGNTAPPTSVLLPAVPKQAQPWLTRLDTQQPNGSMALSASLHEALAELEPDILKRGMGRRIGGWLASSATASTVAAHLSRILVQTAPDGQRMLVRLQDPAVLWPLFGVLTDVQRAALLGPISGWWLLNPTGHLVLLENPQAELDGIRDAEQHEAPSHTPATFLRLSLTDEQWSHVMHLRAFNAAMNQGLRDMPQTMRASLTTQQLDRACTQALAALQRASAAGLTHVEELAQSALDAWLQITPTNNSQEVLTRKFPHGDN